jgi:bla regulator protein blaR1
MIPDSLSPIANHLWQSSLFACVAGLLTLALRKNSARVRRWVWVAASFKFLIPFSVLIAIGGHIGWRTGSAIASANVPVVMEQFSQPFTVTTVSSPILTTALRTPNWLPTILWTVWVCGFIGISISWWIRWQRIRAAVRTGSALHLGLSIRAISSPAFLEPGIFGVFRPILLVPDGIFENLTPEQWKTIIAHELCHVRHRDNLLGIIQMFVETVFWFHPLVWWVGKRIFQERELSCDEEVLRLGSEPRTYAQGILKVCELYLESPVACVAGIAGGANLRKRIELIIANDVRRKLNPTKTVVLTVAGIASLAVPIVVGVMNAPLLMGQALPTSVDSGSTSRLEFEVASIKPAGPMNLRGGADISERAGIPGRCIQKFTLDQGHLDIRCYSLGKLMWAWAFAIPPTRLVGTAWMGDSASDWTGGAKFDISAKLPEGASRDQVPAMLHNLLKSRFKLATHREYREQPVYALIAAKDGLTVQPASQNDDILNAVANAQPSGPMNMNGVSFYGARVPNPDGSGSQMLIMNSPRMGTVRNSESGSPKYITRFEAPDITFGGLADLLTIAGIGPEPVIDLTGEKGRHQVILEMSKAELEALLKDGMRDDIQSAELKAARDGLKKLGLQLVPRKAPIEVLVVDHLEKSPTEN